MRTTIDLPDSLYRKTKAVAALRGSSMKDLIVRSIEHEITQSMSTRGKRRKLKLPVIHLTHLKPGEKLDLTDFNFDDLLT